MKFEVSDRIPTNANRESLLKALEEQLSKVSENVRRDGDSYVAEMIEATFGSINRKDITTVELRDSDDGFLIVGNVDYRPSTWFWVLLIILLFTYIGWIMLFKESLHELRTNLRVHQGKDKRNLNIMNLINLRSWQI